LQPAGLTRVTLRGTILYAKCALEEAKKCTTAIQVKEDGKDVTCYLDDKGHGEEYHEAVCGGDVTVAKVVFTVAALALLAFPASALRRSDDKDGTSGRAIDRQFSLILALMPLLSPVSWNHYLVLLLPLVVLARDVVQAPTWGGLLGLATLGPVLSLPESAYVRWQALIDSEAEELRRLASQCIDQRDHGRAESLLNRSLAIYKELLGEESRPYASTLDLLGCVYIWTGQYARAEQTLQQALRFHKKLAGEEGDAYVNTLGHLAGLYMKTEDYARAKPLLLQVREANKRLHGEEDPYYAGSLNNLGLLYLRTGAYDLAEPLFRQALDIYRKKAGESHHAFGDTLDKLGWRGGRPRRGRLRGPERRSGRGPQ
jgi:tetratricopeptide (TPR) repeat protein